MEAQLRVVVSGYEQFMDFDYRQVSLIEPLRTLRIINYAGWLAQRWNDPAFKVAFPWFGSQRYWEEHIGHIREQGGVDARRVFDLIV
jgi:Ser/Thr protein kinase RdoA (MazF antagonist)